MQDAILKEIYILEAGLNNVSKHKHNPPTPTASFYTNAGRNPHSNHDSSDNKKKHPCVYCSGSHAPSICDVVTDQQKLLSKKGYAHHKISQCNLKFCCRHCKQKYHTSLCTNTESNDKNAQEPQNSTTLTTTLTTTYLHSSRLITSIGR